MLTKYTAKGPVDGFLTNHGERLHKSQAKQPSKRTNQRSVKSFTSQLTRFIQTRDSFFDMYPATTITEHQKPPPFFSHPCPLNDDELMPQLLEDNPRIVGYILCSKQTRYKEFNVLRDVVEQLILLKTIMRLHLNSIIDKNNNSVRVGNTQKMQGEIQVFNQIEMIDYNEDNEKEKNIIRTGDDVLVQDYNKEIRYFNILFFMTIRREDESAHDMCVGYEFKVLNGAHSIGYIRLRKSGVSVCLVNKLQYRVHIVPDFASENDKHYLLNHDINRQCWSNARPLLIQLEEVVKWNDDIVEDENDETASSDTDEEFIDTNERSTEQVDNSFDQFFGYV